MIFLLIHIIIVFIVVCIVIGIEIYSYSFQKRQREVQELKQILQDVVLQNKLSQSLIKELKGQQFGASGNVYPKHHYVPDSEFPQFCKICGYSKHEQLQHPEQKTSVPYVCPCGSKDCLA